MASIVGTSSFGMSGVNAHAIFGQIHPSAEGGGTAKPAAQLLRQRFWPFPWPQKMAVRVGCTPGRALFVADLRAAELAYLSDHKVCRLSRNFLSAGGFFEIKGALASRFRTFFVAGGSSKVTSVGPTFCEILGLWHLR
jgi:hypothetical protein